MAETSAGKEASILMPPEDLRCRKNDGKSWRCSGWRIHGKPMCEKHFLRSMEINAKKKSLTSPKGSKGMEKGFENSRSRGGGKGSGFNVNKSRSLGLGSASRSEKRRGRDGDVSSPEEVLPKKKIRNVGYEKKEGEEETDEEEESDDGEDKRNKGINGGKKKKKVENVGYEKKEGKEEMEEDEESDEGEGKRNKGIKGGKMKKKVESDEGSAEEEEERGVGKRGERSSGIRSGIKKQKIEGNEESDDEEFDKNGKGKSKSSERSLEIGLEDKIGETEECDEEGGVNLEGGLGDSSVEMAKRKGLRTKTIRVRDKKDDEDDYENSDVDADMMDEKGGKLVRGDKGSKTKSHLKRKHNKVRKGKSVGDSGNSDTDDGPQEDDNVCLAKFIRKDFNPEVLSKREDKMLQGKEGEFSSRVKEENAERGNEQEARSDNNICPVNGVVKKAKSSVENISELEEQGRNDQKREEGSETKEEEGDFADELTDSNPVLSKRDKKKLQEKEGELPNKVKAKNAERGRRQEAENEKNVASVGRVVKKAKSTLENKLKLVEQRRSSLKKEAMSDSKVDLRRKHYSNDDPEDNCQMCHQCMASNKKVVRCRKERKIPKGCRRRYC